jgi:hypothetical protein
VGTSGNAGERFGGDRKAAQAAMSARGGADLPRALIR